ncbi:ATP-binding protein [Bacillus sp. UNC438CL73TsuS30]|uniref:ATP-binding protein n=1 Tax=Bacillus sp. UNC438CL73TsuS30 TaxID=1340434 RepID=UPI00068F9F25|nr:ATP-binding protein [Bacillus sp. UNC438CL73TsuS30]
MPKVIFICGIHGSGKTTLGQKLSKVFHYPFDSASNIIKKMAEQNWDNEKRVKDIDKNQNILLRGINILYSQDKFIILDGHFTLLDNEKQISYIPIEMFQNLNLSCVISCITPSEIIVERLKERDGNTSFDVDTLNNFQEAEKVHANNISTQLGIPLLSHKTDKGNLEDLAKKIIKGEILKCN